ncbi:MULTISPECIES: DUF3618 domain-containing protein [unclassified Pseudomonas]|uniref:DUF3618 domain-containing protein n=1 Tax=unclassified Pseudomonas TaxID=196821 RepID=UPI0025F2207D|nr:MULTISPECIES: DUF3618 domain-containing protein [unclassified Pseudomonas]
MNNDNSFANQDSLDSTTRFEADSQKTPEELELEIDQRRASIGSLVDALESKLSPGQMVDQALAYAKGNGGEFFTNLGNTVKANPLPTVLTSVGLLWLALGQNRKPASDEGSVFGGLADRASGIAEQVGDTFGNAKARVQETAAKMKAKASHVSDQASGLGDSVSDLGHRAQDGLSDANARLHSGAQQAGETLRRQGQNLQSSLTYMLREQPLAVAAIGVALGAALGAALPATEKENQLMGAASDKVTGRVKDLATDTYSKASDMGKDFVDNVKSQAAAQPPKPEAGGDAPPNASAV